MRVLYWLIIGALERYVVVPCQKEEMEKMRKGLWNASRATFEQLSSLFKVSISINLDCWVLKDDPCPERATRLSWCC